MSWLRHADTMLLFSNPAKFPHFKKHASPKAIALVLQRFHFPKNRWKWLPEWQVQSLLKTQAAQQRANPGITKTDGKSSTLTFVVVSRISALPRDAVPPFVLPNSTADAKGQWLEGCVPTCDFRMFNLRVQRLLRNQTRRLETGTISKSFSDIFCWKLSAVDCSRWIAPIKTDMKKLQWWENDGRTSAKQVTVGTGGKCKCKERYHPHPTPPHPQLHA